MTAVGPREVRFLTSEIPLHAPKRFTGVPRSYGTCSDPSSARAGACTWPVRGLRLPHSCPHKWFGKVIGLRDLKIPTLFGRQILLGARGLKLPRLNLILQTLNPMVILGGWVFLMSEFPHVTPLRRVQVPVRGLRLPRQNFILQTLSLPPFLNPSIFPRDLWGS